MGDKGYSSVRALRWGVRGRESENTEVGGKSGV